MLRPSVDAVHRRCQVLGGGVERASAGGEAGEQRVCPRGLARSVDCRRRVKRPLRV
jgi:hypothetical protein